MPAKPQAFFLLIRNMTTQQIQCEHWVASKKHRSRQRHFMFP